MKTIAVVSGKGGTGKTTFTAGLASLVKKPFTLVDCDVDAANLCLLFDADEKEKKDFFGADIAHIDQDICVRCGVCMENCRFDAVIYDEAADCYTVKRIGCEGCAVCTVVCPVAAASIERIKTGDIKISDAGSFNIVHADLLPGCGASGLLVKQVKKEAENISAKSDFILIDGPPGIGCPFIATVSGIDYAIIVAEPGLSSLHDLKRARTVIENFGAEIFVVINRYDISSDITKLIEDYCAENGIFVAGKIPYDETVFTSVKNLMPLTEYDCPASKALLNCFNAISEKTGI
ncbi:MAG: ATP-binding protein [Methanomicrobium sp.]|nr:ATP-binding protein [Methanomicrobium sp.]MDD4300071.1 ATP-binding protein [Methanomicrobium sp.]